MRVIRFSPQEGTVGEMRGARRVGTPAQTLLTISGSSYAFGLLDLPVTPFSGPTFGVSACQARQDSNNAGRVPSKGETDGQGINDVHFVLLIHSAPDGVLVR